MRVRELYRGDRIGWLQADAGNSAEGQVQSQSDGQAGSSVAATGRRSDQQDRIDQRIVDPRGLRSRQKDRRRHVGQQTLPHRRTSDAHPGKIDTAGRARAAERPLYQGTRELACVSSCGAVSPTC